MRLLSYMGTRLGTTRYLSHILIGLDYEKGNTIT